MADLVTQADVEQAFGARPLVQLLDDDQDGTADAALVSWMLTTASTRARGILYRAFPSEAKIDTIVAADESVKYDVCCIAIGVAGGRKPGLLSADGETPYTKVGLMGEKRLLQIVRGERRAIGEAAGGTNELFKSQVTPTRDKVFGATAADPKGPGGF